MQLAPVVAPAMSAMPVAPAVVPAVKAILMPQPVVPAMRGMHRRHDVEVTVTPDSGAARRGL